MATKTRKKTDTQQKLKDALWIAVMEEGPANCLAFDRDKHAAIVDEIKAFMDKKTLTVPGFVVSATDMTTLISEIENASCAGYRLDTLLTALRAAK